MMLESVILQVILVVFYYVVPVGSPVLSDGYVSTCPTPSEIKERSLHHPCPENKQYHTVWDPQHNKYKYRCFESRLVPAGKATTLDISGNINAEDCHEGTFQRHPYRSNTQCACMETKGQCNKTGQIVASNGNTTHDRTCRCDFKRGYKISTTPSNNECVCLSSSEDCTCIKEECKTGYRMSPDSKCVLEKLFSTTNYTCQDYIESDDSTTESVPGSDTSVSEESTTESVPDNNTSILERMPTGMVPWYVTAIIAICTALVFFGAGVLLEKKCGVYAPIRICCKKCRPGRNGSAPTNNEGTEHVPVQVTESVATEILSHIKGDESEDEVTNKQPPIEDNYLESDVFIDLSKSAKLENEVTYKQPLTDHSYLENVATEMLSHTEVDESEDEVTNEQPPIEDNYSVNYTESDVFIHMSTSARPEDEVTYKQHLTDHSYLENVATEMLSHTEVDESEDEVTNEQPPIEDNYSVNYTESDVFIHMSTSARPEDEVTYKQHLTDHSYLAQ